MQHRLFVRSTVASASALLMLATLPSCAPRGGGDPAPAPAALAPTARDIHSFARPAEARVTDVALDLRADFESKRLIGTATLAVVTASGAAELVLDTRGLTIDSVTNAGTGRALSFRFGAPDSILGTPLHIAHGGARQVVIAYRTSPSAGALQWLSASQTAGKQHPYLFSQGQSILTRSWIPTQDSPGIRQTYSARLTVPQGLRAVMSAEQLTPDGEASGRTGWRTFAFRLRQPVPPYLIALAVGDIAFRPIGAR